MTDHDAPDDHSQQTLTGESDDVDPLFAGVDEDGPFGSQLIKNQNLLEVGMVPDEDRIVGRDDEIETFAGYLRPIVANGAPTPVLVYGKTGTGKSLVSQHVSGRARNAAERRGRTIAVAYIDCSQHSTEAQAVCALARDLNSKAGSPERIPLKGLGRSHYYTYVWELLETHFDGAITILDEIDRLQPDDEGNRDNILMQLSRARESGKTTKPIGIVGISNKIDWGEELNQRVRSSLGNEELIFPPYDANQLREIMYAREDAFYDGVLEESVIPRAAALAAREHGDARKAIRILKNAGLIAENRGDEMVRETHLDAAQKRAEADRLTELLSTQTAHAKNVLLALALLTEQNDENEFRTTEVFSVYQEVCEHEGDDPLKLDRVRDLLDEQAFLDITEAYLTGGGRGQGTFKVHRLLKDPEVVRNCVNSTYGQDGEISGF
ncbi:Cdc6/Cdc18 family protein [Halomontanus rarus]|uniref:Cdc6/Cdc18 family protein n=1 Tax=Halomontanus rarus TaxID=3034020 RepID=UPI0023E84D09|nr:orc1/cdc6 family replication initiation protein [Halovivax sp. TS33]